METWSIVGTAIVSYLLGIVTGYSASVYLGRALKLSNESYKQLLVIVISVGFIASLAVELVTPTYNVNPLLYGLMGTIVGSFFFTKKQ